MTPWEWLTTTTSVDSVMTALGLGALAVLFARDLIITRGQHNRRVTDLVEHHGRELAEKDARIEDVKESRDGWKSVALEERTRADKATSSIEDVGDTLGRIEHVLSSLDRALPRTPEGMSPR